METDFLTGVPVFATAVGGGCSPDFVAATEIILYKAKETYALLLALVEKANTNYKNVKLIFLMPI